MGGVTDFKECARCYTLLPTDRFYRSNGRAYAYCKRCAHATNVAWKKANRAKANASNRRAVAKAPEKRTTRSRRYHYRKKFGLTIAQYDAMVVSQRGRCHLCKGKPPGRGSHGKGHAILHVDHDHTTGRVRRLLCSKCNVALGWFGEDPERLRAAATYIEEFSRG